MNRKFCRIWFIIGFLLSAGVVSPLFAIYTYDRSGSRTGVVFPEESITSSGKPSVRYEYDAAGRLTAVHRTAVPAQNISEQTTLYTYLPQGWLHVITYPSRVTATFDYFQNGWVESIDIVRSDGGLISKYEYTYDDAGNRTVMQEYNATPAYRAAHPDWFLNPETTRYGYDRQGRLINVEYRAGTAEQRTVDYTYDSVGNRLTEVEKKADGTAIKDRLYSYGLDNRVRTITDRLVLDRSVKYEYNASGDTTAKIIGELDGAGNITTEQYRLAFAWDVAGHLRRVTKVTPTGGGGPPTEQVMAEFCYDSEGRRVRKDGSFVFLLGGPLSAETRLYRYDEKSLLAEYGLVSSTQLSKQRQYVYGAELLDCERATGNGQLTTSYYHQDALGSTINLTKSNGDVEESYLYDAWGNYRELDVNGQSNPAPDVGTDGYFDWLTYLANSQNAFADDFNRFTYTGHEYDPETGLFFFKARFYDPDLGRFDSEDLYLGDSNVPPSLHRYLYAYASPLRYVDLFGYEPYDPNQAEKNAIRLKAIYDGVGNVIHDPKSYNPDPFFKSVAETGVDVGLSTLKEAANLDNIEKGLGQAGEFLINFGKDPGKYFSGFLYLPETAVKGFKRGFTAVGKLLEDRKRMTKAQWQQRCDELGVEVVTEVTRDAIIYYIFGKAGEFAGEAFDAVVKVTEDGRIIPQSAKYGETKVPFLDESKAPVIGPGSAEAETAASMPALTSGEGAGAGASGAVPMRRKFVSGPNGKIQEVWEVDTAAPNGGAGYIESERQLAAPRSATEWRDSPGRVSGGADLPEVTGRWLRGTEGSAGRIPRQIADRLRGRSFNNFADFRDAFWREVAADPVLSRQFSTANRVLMAKGKAPFATPSQVTGLGRAQQVYNLHHLKAVKEGGAVYDLDNIIVTSPAYHGQY